MDLLRKLFTPGELHLSVRTYVSAIVAIVLIPALLFAGWLAMWAAAARRTDLEQDAHSKVREITAAIDREVVGTENMLTALATSRALRKEDFAGFYPQAVEVARRLDVQIVVRSLDSQEQIINTALPWGAPLDEGNAAPRTEAEEQELASGRPGVSNVFFGRLVKRDVVAVTVPVAGDAGARLIISVGIGLHRFAEIVESLDISPDQTAIVIDRAGTIITRSQKNEEYAGTKTVVPLPVPLTAVDHGKNREGIAVHWYNRRSDLTGWVISVSIPDRVLEAPSKFAIASFSVAVGLLLFTAVSLACNLGGRLSHSVGRLGIGRKPTPEEFEILFEAAPNGVLVVDHDGLIALLNAQIVKKFGYRHDELVGRPVEVLLPERFRAAHTDLRKAYVRDPETRSMASGRELVGRRKDGSEFPIEIGLNPIRTGAGNLVMAIVIDLTARKHAAERLSVTSAALAASEDQRLFAVEAAEVGTWQWDAVTGEHTWSAELRHIFGIPAGMPASRAALQEHVHPSDWPAIQETMRNCVAGEGRFEYDFRVPVPDGAGWRWVRAKGRVDRDDTGELSHIRGVVQDITARKAVEAERDALRRRYIQAQEEERLRLAHELHDQTGQSLTAALLELKGIERQAGDHDRNRIRLLRQQLDQMGRTLHHIAWELRPASIDEVGLAAALANYLSEWSAQYGIEADFHCDDARLDELADYARTSIYRIVQEGLTNIAKHAVGATLVSVVIERHDGVLQVMIEDNGSGFDVGAKSTPDDKRHGLGLSGMYERLSLIGGSLEIESSVGGGTTVFVRIPIQLESSAA